MRDLRSIDTRRLREDRALFERFREPDSPIDREILAERVLPLARSLAARYVRPNEPYDDVFQMACIGLVNAIDRYEPGTGSHSPPTRSRRSSGRSSVITATRRRSFMCRATCAIWR
jgi:hypothetical protein